MRWVEKKGGFGEGVLELEKVRETSEEMDLWRRYMGTFRIAVSISQMLSANFGLGTRFFLRTARVMPRASDFDWVAPRTSLELGECSRRKQRVAATCLLAIQRSIFHLLVGSSAWQKTMVVQWAARCSPFRTGDNVLVPSVSRRGVLRRI